MHGKCSIGLVVKRNFPADILSCLSVWEARSSEPSAMAGPGAFASSGENVLASEEVIQGQPVELSFGAAEGASSGPDEGKFSAPFLSEGAVNWFPLVAMIALWL